MMVPGLDLICPAKVRCMLFDLAIKKYQPILFHIHTVGCGQPAAPVNGQVDTPMGTAPGRLANYRCNIGYNMKEPYSTRFCLPFTIEWVPRVPTCQSKS